MTAPESKAAPSRPCINCGQPLPHVGTGWKESGACRRDEGNATLADKATPGMADVLAEHAYVPSGLRGVSRCACGVQFHGMPHDHRAHVAAALSAAGFGDTAAARAEALTEAAKWAIGCEHVTALHWCGGCCDQWRAALEAEAARIARAARPDTGGAE